MPDAGAALDAAAATQFDEFFKLRPEEEAMMAELFRGIDLQRVNRWYGFPSPMWEPPRVHYFRCGRSGDPRAEALAYAMRMIRWKDAPESIRCHGYEVDYISGGKGIYLCITDEGHQIWNAWRAQQRRKKTARTEDESKAILAEAVGTAGASIEHMSITPSRGQVMLDAQRELADKKAARARQPRR